MSRIFISYSHDDKIIAERLSELLRKSYPDVWLDDRLRVGDEWWKEIINHIAEATCFVILLSPEAVKSSYCIDEIEAARKMKKHIIPVKIRRSTEITGQMNFLNELHIVEMLGDVTIQGLNEIYSSIINARFSSLDKFFTSSVQELDSERRKHDLELLTWFWYMVGNKYIDELCTLLNSGSLIEQDEFEDHLPMYRVVRTVPHVAFIDNELEQTFLEFDEVVDEFLEVFYANYGETKDYEHYKLKSRSKESRQIEISIFADTLKEKSKEMVRVIMRWYPKFFVAE